MYNSNTFFIRLLDMKDKPSVLKLFRVAVLTDTFYTAFKIKEDDKEKFLEKEAEITVDRFLSEPYSLGIFKSGELIGFALGALFSFSDKSFGFFTGAEDFVCISRTVSHDLNGDTLIIPFLCSDLVFRKIGAEAMLLDDLQSYFNSFNISLIVPDDCETVMYTRRNFRKQILPSKNLFVFKDSAVRRNT